MELRDLRSRKVSITVDKVSFFIDCLSITVIDVEMTISGVVGVGFEPSISLYLWQIAKDIKSPLAGQVFFRPSAESVSGMYICTSK